MESLFVTYDVQGPVTRPVARRIPLDRPIDGWRIGSFEREQGGLVHGIVLYYEGGGQGFVDVPSDVVNLQLRTGVLPEHYRRVMDPAECATRVAS